MRRQRSQHRRAPWLTAAGGTVVLAFAVSVVIVRRRRGARDPSRRVWSCDCGQTYVVSGIDRHRVYWLPDAAEADPLLVRNCVSCGVELPAGHDAAVDLMASAAEQPTS